MAPRIKKKPIVTAREETRIVTVASPTVPGAQEVLEYIPTILDKVSGKQRLLPEQRMAAEKYRAAWDMLQGPRAMQWESGIQITRGPKVSPAIPLMMAGETLAQATQELGRDVLIVEAVLGYGFTMEETAYRLYERKASRQDTEYIGRTFRESLTILAKRWFPDKNKGARIPLFYRGFNELTSDGEFVEGGSTAHASVGKVDIRRRT